MFKHYKKELTAIATVFGLISWSIYVSAESIMMKPPVIKVAELAKPAPKEVKKPVTTKEIVVTPDPKKDPNRKKPTLKKKYADKK
jgi:hypothetical protein